MGKIIKFSDFGFEYELDYRNVKYPRLEFKTGQLIVVMPSDYLGENMIITKHEEWIKKKDTEIKSMMKRAEKKKLNTRRTETELINFVDKQVVKYCHKYGFVFGRLIFRDMKSKWGSHSAKNNLTFNKLMKYLSPKLIRYVVFHELVHSKERKHNIQFWRLIEKEFPDYKKLEKGLFEYWFLVNKL